ncbi:DUF1761 domain-containing protein [Candidatus Woesearchaeota archaeon]|nr:DUF1761 domain-containing protein [Candidatus Woesearchaeota archaeon]
MIQAVEINYLAVLVAAIVNMVIGALWYSPVLFGNLWAKLSGMDKKSTGKPKQKGMAKLYLAAFVSTLVMSFVLAHFIAYTESTTVSDGMQAGFWLWLGFIATVSIGGVLWENKPMKLWFLNNAYNLFSLLVTGSILAVWQ